MTVLCAPNPPEHNHNAGNKDGAAARARQHAQRMRELGFVEQPDGTWLRAPHRP
jgi:hypothetical protein